MAVFTDRSFGVEIETIWGGTRVQLRQELERVTGIEIRNVEDDIHASIPSWKIVPDSSVMGRGQAEIVSPGPPAVLRRQEGLDQVQKIMTGLLALGCRPNFSTGLHVHHGAFDMGIVQRHTVAAIYEKWFPVIRFLFRRLRQDIGTARLFGLTQAEFKLACDRGSLAAEENRYHTVNLAAFYRHKTIEFRQHHGSLYFEETKSWIVFTQLIMEAGKEQNHRFTDLAPQSENLWLRMRRALGTRGQETPNDDLVEDAMRYLRRVFFASGGGDGANANGGVFEAEPTGLPPSLPSIISPLPSVAPPPMLPPLPEVDRIVFTTIRNVPNAISVTHISNISGIREGAVFESARRLLLAGHIARSPTNNVRFYTTPLGASVYSSPSA